MGPQEGANVSKRMHLYFNDSDPLDLLDFDMLEASYRNNVPISILDTCQLPRRT